MMYDHLAFVKRPADQNAFVSKVSITDNKDGTVRMFIQDEVLVMTVENISSLEDKVVERFNQLLEAKDYENKFIQKEVYDNYKVMSEKGRNHSFLFSDSKNIYLKDKLGLLLSKITLDSITEDEENKEELESLRNVVDTLIKTNKYIQADDSFSFKNEYEKLLLDKVLDSKEEVKKDDSNDKKLILNKETIDSIADAVFNKIKQDTSKVDNYTKDRVKTLELAIIELEDKLSNYSSRIESIALANKFENDCKDTDSALKFLEDNFKKEEISDNEKELEKLSLNDNIIVDDNKVEDNKEIEKEEIEDLSLAMIGDSYREILRTKGFKEAKAYLKELKDQGKIPNNFVL